MKTLPKKKTMTVAEVAEYFGVWQTTVLDWISAGKFPGADKISDKRTAPYLIPTAEVEAFEKEKARNQSGN